MKKHSFTLVELLIVVAVIAILAGLLLPALNKAMGTARKISCVNNLRQIGVACVQYVNANNDWTFYVYSDKYHEWQYIFTSGDWGIPKSSIYSRSSPLNCPGNPNPTSGMSSDTDKFNSYAAAGYSAESNDKNKLDVHNYCRHKINKFPQPSVQVAIFDHFSHKSSGKASSGKMLTSVYTAETEKEKEIWTRHNQTVNTVRVDGSAKSWKQQLPGAASYGKDASGYFINSMMWSDVRLNSSNVSELDGVIH